MLGDETDSCSNHTALPRPGKVVLFTIDLTVGTAATLIDWHRRKSPNDEVFTMEVAMSLRTMIAAGALGVISLATPAFGQTQYGYRGYAQPSLFSGLWLPLVLLALAAFLHWANQEGWFSSESSGSPCGCDECQAERYESQAELMREITKHQDAHTAMMRSEIELTRISAVYGERPDIAAHEQRLHELRNQLQQGGRK